MKSITLILAIGIIALACGNNSESTESTETTETADTTSSYGPVTVDPAKAITVEEMLAKMEGVTDSTEFTFVGELTEVCSKAGCWVNIDKGNNETFMVRFKDHFTIPTDTEIGSTAYFHGYAYWDTIPVDMLQHFAEDAGKSKEEIKAITEPKFEMAFEADGILFK